MTFGRDIKRRLRNVLGSVLGALLVGYFAYHSIEGDRGILAWRKYDLRIEQVETRLAQVRAEHDRMNRRVALLRSESLDPDMLDERARVLLDLSRADKLVIRGTWVGAGNIRSASLTQ